MDLTITISPEQEKALIRSNESTNPDPLTRPTLDKFAQYVFDQKCSEHIKVWADRDAADVAAKLASNVYTMTPEDKATVVAILDKYQLKPPTEVEPPPAEPIP